MTKTTKDNAIEFELNGTIYRRPDAKKNYVYKSTGKTDGKGNPVMMRIPLHIFEQAFDEYVDQNDDIADADEAYNERKEAQAKADAETEAEFNGKKPAKAKKASKPRKSKDIAYTHTNGLTLTAKQVDFIKHIPDTCFYEHGLESTMWCDVLADEIGGQFEGKPMTVGAMISTLREKNLINVGKDDSRKGHPKFMVLTDMGKQVATELGLN